MTEETLIKLTTEADNTLESFNRVYGVSPLSLAAIFLARLKLMNEAVGSIEDFNKLVTTVAHTPQQRNETKVH